MIDTEDVELFIVNACISFVVGLLALVATNNPYSGIYGFIYSLGRSVGVYSKSSRKSKYSIQNLITSILGNIFGIIIIIALWHI